MKIVVIQGPNLNLLGTREPQIYGGMKLEQIHDQMRGFATQNGLEIEFFQSNIEGELIDRIHECMDDTQGIIINAGGYTHTSIALRDAITAVMIPAIEVHISNVFRREEFRHNSMLSPVCAGTIGGFGPFGYHLALMAMIQIFTELQALQQAQIENTK
jgi:3-dehydroquinate dehydratase-2